MRSRLSYSQRLQQDIEMAKKLNRDDIVELLENKLNELKKYKREYYQRKKGQNVIR